MGYKAGTLNVFSDSRDLEEVIAAYKAGASLNQLARMHEVTVSTIRNALVQSGVTINSNLRNPSNKMGSAEVDQAKDLYLSGLTFEQVGKKLGRSDTAVIRVLYRDYPEIIRQEKTGPGSPHWKGGRSKDSNGYTYVWIAPDDPMASMSTSNRGTLYVYEHRLVMARKLGRPLLSTETVHHINGVITDNRPENLQLRQGRHGKHSVMRCADCGSLNIEHAPLSETKPETTYGRREKARSH